MPIVDQYMTSPRSTHQVDQSCINNPPICKPLTDSIVSSQYFTNPPIIDQSYNLMHHLYSANSHNPHNQGIHIHIYTHITVSQIIPIGTQLAKVMSILNQSVRTYQVYLKELVL